MIEQSFTLHENNWLKTVKRKDIPKESFTITGLVGVGGGAANAALLLINNGIKGEA